MKPKFKKGDIVKIRYTIYKLLYISGNWANAEPIGNWVNSESIHYYKSKTREMWMVELENAELVEKSCAHPHTTLFQ